LEVVEAMQRHLAKEAAR